MGALRESASAVPTNRMSSERFLDMIESRPREERWQLVEGQPFAMMTPPTMIHQRIALNCAAALNEALAVSRPDLFTLIEVGLVVEGRETYRPIADFAVVEALAQDTSYASRFLLAGEVLSRSNTAERINEKRSFYASAPECLHVLILSQTEAACEVWSRANDWQGRVFRLPDDRIELPEFGFSCRLADLYKGTPVA